VITQTECQVCHRIDFGERLHCAECDWPIRSYVLAQPVYGFDLRIEVNPTGNRVEQRTVHFKTSSEAVARSRAKRVRDFWKVLAVRPLTEKQYIDAYGEGRM
jgi:hypothetical protein